MKTAGKIAGLIALGICVSGCTMLRKTFGSDKRPPDEFEVVGQAPLAMPPDFTLRPPRPGEPRPQELDSTSVAIDALFPGRTSVPPKGSAGEQALLKQLDKDGSVTPNARSNVGDGQTKVVEKGILLRDVINAPERMVAADGNKIERVSSTPASPN